MSMMEKSIKICRDVRCACRMLACFVKDDDYFVCTLINDNINDTLL